MKTLQHLLDRNLSWATDMKQKDPEFFSRLSKQQTPEYLWIGCSDSRVPANQIVDLPPGEVFVHRNIANIVAHTDLNCLSVIQFAVELLKVKHIIVCGHYGCGGVEAAMGDQEHGLIDNWLSHLRDVRRFNADRLESLTGTRKADLFCELNVIEQVKHVCSSTIVQAAWRGGARLTVHGWVYSVEDGVLKDLNVCASSRDEINQRLPGA